MSKLFTFAVWLFLLASVGCFAKYIYSKLIEAQSTGIFNYGDIIKVEEEVQPFVFKLQVVMHSIYLAISVIAFVFFFISGLWHLMIN